MGVIKAKNSAGEWVNVASAEATTIHNELMGDLKMATEEFTWGNRSNSIDLSKYVGADNDFFLILALHSYGTASLSQTSVFAWHRTNNATTGSLLLDTVGRTQTSLTDGIFATSAGSNVTFTYDENTQIFTLNDDTYKYIYEFTILYAGVKEA